MDRIQHYFTTPLYYVNSKPHIGHTFTTVVTDIVKRYYKQFDESVYLLTGTDEHGEKIEEAAKNEGIEVNTFADKYSKMFRDMWDNMDLQYDDFIRTTEERHKKVVRYILQKLYDKGDIYFDSYEGKYCVGCERFISDADLTDGKCPYHNTEPKIVKEENYFFRMSKYTGAFKNKIEETPGLIRPLWYRNEVLGYLKDHIDDLCISRPKERLKWGIELPFDENFVTYVWFDALINYISAVGYPDDQDFMEYWKNSEHFIAKDILRTHTIYWGTMLIAADIPLYKHLNVHGYWNMAGLKMSKSLGNVIEPKKFKKTYGDQGLRFFFLKEMHWGDDSDFTLERFIGSYNAYLANNYGNLISRTLGMIEKYYKDTDELNIRNYLSEDHALKKQLDEVIVSYLNDFRVYEFYKTLDKMWLLFDETNKFIADSKPWDLAKENKKEELNTIIAPVIEIIRICTYMLNPVMPEVTGQILKQLGFDTIEDLNFNDFSRWGCVKTIPTKYENKRFFDRKEPVND